MFLLQNFIDFERDVAYLQETSYKYDKYTYTHKNTYIQIGETINMRRKV